MKISIIAHLNHNLAGGDMGTRKVAFHIAAELAKRHEVESVEATDIKSWLKIRAFKPEVIHAILGPSTLGFVAAKSLAFCSRGAKLIMSAPNPSYLPIRRLIPLFKPDLILTQSYESERLFANLGLKTRFLPNGVDTERFAPGYKQKLRQKYGLDIAKFVILHIGPVIRERSVQSIRKLHDGGSQVIIIGRKPVQRELYSRLKEKGCIVTLDYIENVEEIYALSDCYLFPTPRQNKQASIELPLSVLEAMSCNLPVITTRFGALPRMFKEGNGLLFIENEEEITKAIEAIRSNNIKIKTREKVLPYSWEKVVENLEEIYEKLLS